MFGYVRINHVAAQYLQLCSLNMFLTSKFNYLLLFSNPTQFLDPYPWKLKVGLQIDGSLLIKCSSSRKWILTIIITTCSSKIIMDNEHHVTWLGNLNLKWISLWSTQKVSSILTCITKMNCLIKYDKLWIIYCCTLLNEFMICSKSLVVSRMHCFDRMFNQIR
jgi:hypothetical protein